MTRKTSLLLLGLLLLLGGCAAYQPTAVTAAADIPGFFSGVWHGLIMPFSLIVGVFTDVRVYAAPNSGWWYDFGFFLGVGGLAGVGFFR